LGGRGYRGPLATTSSTKVEVQSPGHDVQRFISGLVQQFDASSRSMEGTVDNQYDIYFGSSRFLGKSL